MAATWIIAIAAISLTATYIIYRLFDNLSSFPGPKLWSLSQLPWHICGFRGILPFKLQSLHEKYGPVVRIGPNEISVAATSLDTWKTIHAHKPMEMPKNKSGTGLPTSAKGPKNIITASIDDHTRMRKALLPAFSDKALKAQEGYIVTHIQKLLGILSTACESGEKVDLAKLLNLTTFDILGELAFGEPFGGLENVEFHPWVNGILQTIRAVPFLQFAVYYGLFGFVRYVTPRKLLKQRDFHVKSAQDKVKRRLERKSESRSDFIAFLYSGEEEKNAVNVKELELNAQLLTIAGSETSATHLSSAMFLLLTHPESMEKIQQEVRSTFRAANEINLTAVDSLKYLGCVMQEALRLHPPLPATSSRVVPGKGEMVENRWVPPGTNLGINHWSTYHLSSNFHNPRDFAPERWLPEGERPSKYQNDRREVCQPFAYGNRSCIGQRLADAEVRLILSHMLLAFNLTICQESRHWNTQHAYLAWERKPLMVTLEAV